MTDYVRVILTGLLITQTDLHIGTGEECTSNDPDMQAQSYNDICHAVDGIPYIPASTMRGYLRNILEEHEDPATVETLFGLARGGDSGDNSGDNQKANVNANEQGRAGRLRVYDARWQSSPQFKIDDHLKTKTSIDPLTATSKDFHLSTHAQVPANSRFKLEIEMDHISQTQLSYVLKALKTLGEDYQGQIGKSKTDGMGKLHWHLSSIKTLTPAQLKKWLKNDKSDINYSPMPDDFNQGIESYSNPNTHQQYKLQSLSPLLIIDSEFTNKKKKQWETEIKQNENRANKPHDHYFMREGNQAIIPGSTLKGWVRARCRKILLTLLTKDHATLEHEQTILSKTADELLNQLFGSTNQRGIITFNSAKAEFSEANDNQKTDIHQQTFIAVDRFTGGVKDGALFSVEAIWAKKPFQGEISYDESKLKNWMKLLLLFVLRDAMQGDLVLGWGKSRGYGQLTLSTDQYTNWQAISEQLDEKQLQLQLQQWQVELDDQLANGLKQQMQKYASPTASQKIKEQTA